MNMAVRPAVEGDIPLIENWLKAYHNDFESLYGNWPLIVREYKKEGMLVYEDQETKAPVAYFWGALTSANSVLEVRAEFRGRGIGRLFVLELFKLAEIAGEGLLCIECAPSSSESFWKAMGFEIEDGCHTAKRILNIPRTIPASTTPARVAVRFFNESVLHSQGEAPLAEYHPAAGRAIDGTIWLNAKLAYFHPTDGRDLVLEVEVDGTRIYFDKAKRSAGKAIGVLACENGFALEKITLQGTVHG